MGTWFDWFEREITQDEFDAEIDRWISQVAHRDWVITADTKEGHIPSALVLGIWDLPGRVIKPHIDWFPWATPRVIYEGASHFFRNVRKEMKIMVLCSDKDQPFYERMRQNRLLTYTKAPIKDYFAPGEDAHQYYTQGPFDG